MAMMKFANNNNNKTLKKTTCKILIVDDESEIHSVTKTVMSQFVFENQKLELLSAYSGEEAIEILKKNPDIQLVLLDVVMESDNAGLIVVKKIREELKMKKIRIVLRTGQPGSAPEHSIIDNYDINDYKEKTELTSTKLYTTIISSLRAYRDLEIIDRNKRALEKIIEASKTIFKLSSFYLFVEGALNQISSILNIDSSLFETESENCFFATLSGDEFKLIASSGSFKGVNSSKVLTTQTLAYLGRVYRQKESFFEDDKFVAFYEAVNDKILFLYTEGCSKLSDSDKEYLQVFSDNVSIAFNNICLNSSLIEEEKELVKICGKFILGFDIFAKNKSKESLSKLLKEKIPLQEDEISINHFLKYYEKINSFEEAHSIV